MIARHHPIDIAKKLLLGLEVCRNLILLESSQKTQAFVELLGKSLGFRV